MANPVLELRHVSVSFDSSDTTVEVLNDVSLKLFEGEFVSVLGFAGSGKTTLVNLLAGLTQPTKGNVYFRGKPVWDAGPERGVVFQSYCLLPWLTTRGNIELAIKAVRKKLTRAELQEHADYYLELVGLSHAQDRRPAALSGGMRQRVALARTLAMEPEVLLLDEPLSALDALTRTNLQEELQSIWLKERHTVLLVTNDVNEAFYLSDRVLLLTPEGRLDEQISIPLQHSRDRAAIAHSASATRIKRRITNFLNGQKNVQSTSLSRTLPNVTPLHALPRAYQVATKSLLTTRYLQFSQLEKTFISDKGSLTVVEDFELSLDKGEFISLIGHSGCGKSTVLSMTAGLSDISAGAIVLDGKHVESADPERAVVFQAPSLFSWLTARQNIALGLSRVYPSASSKERKEIVEYYLDRVGLIEHADMHARDLSNGLCQLVGLARAFALSPKLLLLDEPFGMLDSLTRWNLQEVLMDVWTQAKVTAICVTHDVDEAILLADKVVMMTNGPRAKVGHIMNVDLARPRTRKSMLEHPKYLSYRDELLGFLQENETGHLLRAS